MPITFVSEQEEILDISLTPITVAFDPWQYDKNLSRYIEKEEAIQAINDYLLYGIKTKEQAEQVTELWESNIRNPDYPLAPTPPLLPPMPPPEADELLVKLQSGEIGANWWNYITAERWEIAHYIGEYSASLPIGRYYAKGDWDCAGEPYTSKIKNQCITHFTIRYSLIGDPSIGGRLRSQWYWQDRNGNWHCIFNPNAFDLPLYHASNASRWFISSGPWMTHSICALQIDSNFSNFNSWLFFQYTDADIKPLVTGKYVTANELQVGDLLVIMPVNKFEVIFSSGLGLNILAAWEITGAGPVPYTGPFEK